MILEWFQGRHTNLIFDVLIPANDQISHQILKNKISAEVQTNSDEYHCVH